MRLNKSAVYTPLTHEGAPAKRESPIDKLQRSVVNCLLWDDTFYEEGEAIAERIATLTTQVKPEHAYAVAMEACDLHRLRHAPLWVAVSMAENRMQYAEQALRHVIRRPDQMGEALSMYWKEGKRPIPAAMKRALRHSFSRFDEYQFSKWNRKRDRISLADLVKLLHPCPRDEAQSALFAKLLGGKTAAKGGLKTANTWETRMSGGESKKTTFTDLLDPNKPGKIGDMAFLMNLRNMREAGVSRDLVKLRFAGGLKMPFPYRYITAAKAVPEWEDLIEPGFLKVAGSLPKLPGKTIILVDCSGSMFGAWGMFGSKGLMQRGKGDSLTFFERAASLAMIGRELCEEVAIYGYSGSPTRVPPRRGFALRDALQKVAAMSGTYTGRAIRESMAANPDVRRLLVITDGQSHDIIPVNAGDGVGVIMNVAPYEKTMKYSNGWEHVTGFSEHVFQWAGAREKL